MTRQNLRNSYPFHNANPRHHVACCYRKPIKRTLLQRVLAYLFN